MKILKKAAYIKGLMEGLNIDDKTTEGKLLTKIIDLLDDICDEIGDVREELDEVWDVIDDLDGDLRDLENDILCDDNCKCDNHYHNNCICLKCPKCGSEYYMKYTDLTDEELENNAIRCPNCKEKIDIDEYLICDDEYDKICGCGKENCSCDNNDSCCDCNDDDYDCDCEQ